MTRIVAGLGRGVKKINGTQTLAGANNWIAKNKPGQNWDAFEEDITGPNGKPDGLKEVVICDAKGNVRVVNGYTLCGSDYQWRKDYYTAYPNIADQKKVRFSEYKSRVSRVSNELDENGKLQYSGSTQFVKRHKFTPKQAFKQVFFAPVYKELYHGK